MFSVNIYFLLFMDIVLLKYGKSPLTFMTSATQFLFRLRACKFQEFNVETDFQTLHGTGFCLGRGGGGGGGGILG